jgi:hypothetical protein
MTGVRMVTAQITEDGPLQGAEVRISWLPNEIRPFVEVHLPAIGDHPEQWIAIQTADRLITKLTDAADPFAEVAASHDDRAVARTERRLRDAG